MSVLQSLIDKTDTFEQIRDQIAAILVNEIQNQKALAVTAGKDPLKWDLRVFLDCSNPIAQYLPETDGTVSDKRPIVNIWYSGTEFDESKSNVVKDQCGRMDFNIDVYAYGESQSTVTGHNPGDKVAAFELDRSVRLVRNILMASPNTYLQLQGLVWKRWINTITAFQPTFENRAVENIQAARFSFQVWASEFSPQYTGQAFEYLSIQIKRENGEVLAQADYNYA